MTGDGTAVIVGGEGGGRLIGITRQLRAVATSPFIGQRLTMMLASEDRTHLERLVELIDAGSVTPAVDRTFPLADAADAMRRLEAGQVCGKLAIAM